MYTILERQLSFVCVDGPEFDGHQVDFGDLAARLRGYRDEEPRALEPDVPRRARRVRPPQPRPRRRIRIRPRRRRAARANDDYLRKL
jgi:hypothetical protein